MPVYCITGANRGLGLEFVRQLAADPANTILATSRSIAPPDLGDLKSVSSATTHILQCDTSSEDSIRAFVREAQSVLGGAAKIDVLVNNAGVNRSPGQTSLALDAAALHANVAVNVLGPAWTVQRLLGAGLLAPDARVVNLGSGLGSLRQSAAVVPRKSAPYSISKAGLNMLTVHLSEDLRAHLPGAVVVSLGPGWVKTRMGGEEALLEAEESVRGMLKVVAGLKGEDNGRFFNHDGSEVPW